MCDVARQVGVERFLHISTDEVYGSIEDGLVHGDRPARAPLALLGVEGRLGPDRARRTTRRTACPCSSPGSSNNFGPYQFPEKVIPLFVTNLLDGQKVPLYGDGLNVRDWCYVERQLRRRRPRAAQRARSARSTTSARGNEITNRELTDTHPGRCSAATSDDRATSRTASATTAATRSTPPRSQALGWAPGARLRRGARRDGRVVPRQPPAWWGAP